MSALDWFAATAFAGILVFGLAGTVLIFVSLVRGRRR